MCLKRWMLYCAMSDAYYYGSDPIRRSVYRRAKAAYSAHLCQCKECRSLILAGLERSTVVMEMDESLEIRLAKERGVE